MRVETGIWMLQVALGLGCGTAKYTECQGETHIKAGDCNSPAAPCKSGTGYTNVHQTDSLAACEAKCDAALPKGNCAGVTWHDASAGEWARTCVLETADAWAGTALHQAGHISACNGLAPCKCSSAPPGPPRPPKIDAAGCIVKRAALAYSQKALSPPRHADLISNALDFTGCPPATDPGSTDVSASPVRPPHVRVNSGEPNFYVDAGKGSDSAAGTSADSAFKTMHKAQMAARAVAGATVHLLPGATHYLTKTLTLTPEDSHVSWVGAAASALSSPASSSEVVVSGAVSLSATCMGKWKQAGGHTGSAAAYSCQLPPGTQFDSLFLNGLRQQKARFPNGDPLAIKDGYEKGCQAVDWFDISGIKEYPTNLQMVSKSGAHISQGSVFPPEANRTVVIADRTAPREGETTGNNPSYYNTRFNETYNHPFWATTAPSAIKLSKGIAARSANWKSPKGAVVRMLHPAGWGGWAFEVKSVQNEVMNFTKGGFQEARGNKGCGAMYVEGIEEELDSPGEWFLSQSGLLSLVPPVGMTLKQLQVARVEAPRLKTLVEFRGTAIAPVTGVHMSGFNLTGAAQTFLESYEAPSGGDWSVHRGGAVFLHGAVNISLTNIKFDQLEGNAVTLSNFVKGSSVVDCDFWRTGDSAIIAVGSTKLTNATASEYPHMNSIERNYIDTVGVNMKQTSCYFKAMTYSNIIRDNMCFNGPRAGLNWNDGFMGGDLVEGNVIWNMVRETGDHGTFNSWDRREWFFDCALSGSTQSGNCLMPKMIRTQHNMFIGPAGWNMDHDDGSTNFHDFSNLVYQGGYKYRDGTNRNMSNNLMIAATPKFQISGFDTDIYSNNIQVNTGNKVCGPSTLGGLSGNSFLTLEGDSSTDAGSHSDHPEVAAPPPNKCDTAPAQNVTAARLLELVMKTVAHSTVPIDVLLAKP